MTDAVELNPESSFVARQPIVGIDLDTMGYELLFRDGWENIYPNLPSDHATSRLIVETQLDLGLEKLVGTKNAFINFSENALMEKLPLLFDKEQVVVEILETVNPSAELVESCRQLRDIGYKLALDDFDFSAQWDGLQGVVDLVKVDISDFNQDELEQKVSGFKRIHKHLLAERVETHDQFDFCKEMGFDYFQGFFFSEPEVIENKKLTSNRVLILELLKQAGTSPIDFEKLSEIISRDVGLSYRLLKMINSPAFGVAGGITSLQHAITFLGEEEVRKFVSLVAFASIGAEKPPELLALATVRARFCEMLAKGMSGRVEAGSAFLCGLFSVIDAVMNDSLEQIFLQLPLDRELKDALRGAPGNKIGELLQLAIAYERGNWSKANELAQGLKLEEFIISKSYREAICWSRSFQTALKE